VTSYNSVQGSLRVVTSRFYEMLFLLYEQWISFNGDKLKVM
jgi:hypothetical protein